MKYNDTKLSIQESNELFLEALRQAIMLEIADKGICPECATPLIEDTDGTLYCKGCGYTATPKN